jgi:PAS domain S-box-containing protein
MAVVAVTGLCLSAAISERKEAEESRLRLAAILEYSDDAIIGKDLNGIITFWNAGAERLFGYSAAEIVGHSINMIIPDNRRAEERYIVQRLKRSERIDHYETLRQAKDGRLIDVSLTVSPIRNTEGNIVGASNVSRDITDRKQVEEALKESDRRKDEFLATLAHELRNPLAPLTNALRILERPDADSSQRQEAHEIMSRQLQQMTRLVDDLLDVSRITHGKVELRKSPILLADAVGNAVETVMPKAQDSGHELVVHLPGEPVWVDADPVRLSQVFANLLSNSVKYTPRSGHIQVDAEATAHEVIIRVRDSGIGIPDSQLPRIFDMFMQVDNSIERAHGGLGIGLTLVKNLVQLHGGSIEAKSDGINQGSEFMVRLPRVPPPAAESELPLTPVKTPTRRLKVLVVDDSPAVAKTLGWMVELLGHEVRVANDGVSAVIMAHEFVPDVVLLDIGLSGMSGYEVCKKMCADPVLSHTTFIAQTGWGQPEHRRRSKEAGFHHHLVKPIDMAVLEKLFSSL